MSYRSEIVNKVGRPPKVKTPEELWTQFIAYVEFTDQHPVDLPQTIVKGSNRTEGRGGKVARPLTLQGFAAWLGLGVSWSDFKRFNAERDGFLAVITRVENAVRGDQIEGGLAGIYNSNITARLNGLVDRQDTTSGGKPLDLKFEIVRRGEGE